MNDPLHNAVADGLEYLRDLQRDGARTDEARARLRKVRGRHPDLAIDLFDEEEAYDGSVHYDVLLRLEGEGTVSLSYCPERATPWPLRGVQRWSDAHLVRVNATLLKVEHAIALMDFIWDQAPLVEQLVNACLVREELDREPIDLTDAELQEAMNRFRAAKKLFKAEDTRRWLEQHGMSHEALEQYVADDAIMGKLRDRIAGDRVAKYFREHERDFDRVRVARLQIAHEGRAREIADDVRRGRVDFYAAAERCFGYASDRGDSAGPNLFAVIERCKSAPLLREQLFPAESSQLVGPVPVDSGYALFKVLAKVPARLDARTRDAIKGVLFEEWLADRRRTARIEWNWGNASQTS
jgi:putative peptide maturation system protein